MSKRCNITNVKPMVGNNVSHAVNKTKRKFFPNLQNTSFYSEILGKKIKLRVTSKGIKTVEKASSRIKFSAKTQFCLIFGSLLDPLGDILAYRNAFLEPPTALSKFGATDLDRPEAAWVPAERFLA